MPNLKIESKTRQFKNNIVYISEFEVVICNIPPISFLCYLRYKDHMEMECIYNYYRINKDEIESKSDVYKLQHIMLETKHWIETDAISYVCKELLRCVIIQDKIRDGRYWE